MHSFATFFRLSALLFLAVISTPSFAQSSFTVGPFVGPWEYWAQRNDWTYKGLPTEDAAIEVALWQYNKSAQAPNYYGDPTPTNDWHDTKYDFGLEGWATRGYLTTYLPGTGQDGFEVIKTRDIRCPDGYSASGVNCVRSPGIANPDKGSDEVCNGTNPIEGATLTKVQFESDFDLGGGFAFGRFYSSRGTWSYSTVGQNWRHNFSASIHLADVAVSGAVVTAWVRRADGRLIPFNKVSSTVWQPEADVTLKLTPLYDSGGVLTGWTLRDGTRVETYNAVGLLVRIETADDVALTLAYSGSILQSVTDERGRKITFVYDVLNHLTKVVESSGAEHLFAYDYYRRLDYATFPEVDGFKIKRDYHYEISDSSPLLTGISEVTIQGSNQSSVRTNTWAYDAATKEAELSVHGDSTALIDRYVLERNPITGTTSILDPIGKTRTYAFAIDHGVRRITAVSDPGQHCGGSTIKSRTYDANGYVATSTDFGGAVTHYERDANGLPATITRAEGSSIEREETYLWDTTFRLPTQQTLPGLRHAYTYNSRGQVTWHVATDLATTATRTATAAYCEQAQINSGACPILGLLTSVNGPRTDVTDLTQYTYRQADHANCTATPRNCPYRKGDLWKVTNALGKVTEYLSRDDNGRLTSLKDANGVITDIQYSARGWVIATKIRGADGATEADDAITLFNYLPNGMLSKVTQPDGSFQTFTYDSAHRLVGVADSVGNVIAYTLDSVGNRVLDETKDQQNTVRKSLSRAYNDLGQLESTIDYRNALTDVLYDGNGVVSQVTDALGRQAHREVDALGRLSLSIRNATGSGAETASTGYSYDGRGNLVKVTDPKSLETIYSYNGFNDLTQLASPDTGTSTFGYDGAGNVVTKLDARGVAIGYTYDALNRVTGVNFPNDADVAYTYDTPESDCLTGETFGAGRLAKMSVGADSTRYCYDRLGRVVRKVQTLSSGTTLSVGSTYDGAGNLVSMTYPSGAIVTYLRNANGQIDKVLANPTATAAQATIVEEVGYAPFGPITSIKFGNARTQDRAYDLNYGVDAITESNGAGGFSADYGLDDLGSVSTLTERGTLARTYEYDGQDRLKTMKDGAAATIESYQYDATGNRTSKTVGATSYTYSYPVPALNHRLTNISNNGTRSYDSNGNTTNIGTGTPVAMTYNDSSRLKTVTLGGVLVRTYQYNGKGERVFRTVHSGSMPTVQFVYDESGHLLGEYMANGSRVVEYVWAGNVVVGTLRSHDGTNYQYVETDHLGTPRAVINPSTNVVIWRWDLAATGFGDGGTNTDPDGNAIAFSFNLRYPGQYYDGIEQIYYNYYRDYDSRTGRYLQSDPIGLRGGVSTYSYVDGGPLGAVDPFGLFLDSARAACLQNPAVCAEVVATPGRSGAVSAVSAAGAAGARGLLGGDTPSDEDVCPDDDNCAKILKRIWRLINEINRRTDESYEDKCNQYLYAYSAPNPNLGKGCTSTYWLGHLELITNLKVGLQKEIVKAISEGCPLPWEAFEAAYSDNPTMPRRL
jgi:RHS repeat-associated protein